MQLIDDKLDLLQVRCAPFSACGRRGGGGGGGLSGAVLLQIELHAHNFPTFGSVDAGPPLKTGGQVDQVLAMVSDGDDDSEPGAELVDWVLANWPTNLRVWLKEKWGRKARLGERLTAGYDTYTNPSAHLDKMYKRMPSDAEKHIIKIFVDEQ
eukprot:SAG11_NODE_973_length_6335_cov_5.646889_2_plen_153_part_00